MIAIDLTDKKMSTAQEVVNLVNRLSDDLATLASIRDGLTAAGITYATDDFVGVSGLKHMTGDDMNALLAQFDYTNNAVLLGWMALVGSPTPRVIFAKVIPN